MTSTEDEKPGAEAKPETKMYTSQAKRRAYVGEVLKAAALMAISERMKKAKKEGESDTKK